MALLFPESDPVFHAARPDPIVVFPAGDVADPSPMNINDGFHRWWYPKMVGLFHGKSYQTG